MGRYCVAVHAVERYLERVEGIRVTDPGRDEMERVKAIILAVPAVRAAVRTYATLKIKASWGKIVVEQGTVVTIIPVGEARKFKMHKREKEGRYGRRTRDYRMHVEGAGF